MAGYFGITISPSEGPGNSTFTVTVTSYDSFKGTVTLGCETGSTTCDLVSESLMVCEDESKSTGCQVGPVVALDTLTVTGTHGGISRSASATITP